MPSNRLNKKIRYTDGELTLVTPPTPARTVYEEREVCGMRYSVPGRYEVVVDPASSVASLRFFPTDGTVEGLTGTWLCDRQMVRVDYPARPGGTEVVPVTRADSNLGWNSGARSIGVLFANAWAEFKVRQSVVGVICGLNSDDGAPEYRGNLVDFGFYCFRGQALVMENGVVKATAGAYTDATVFRVERTGTSVAYKVDGVTKYTNSAAGTAPVWLEASMYSAGDEVFDPVLNQVSALPTTGGATLALVLPPVRSYLLSGVSALLECVLPPVRESLESGFLEPAYKVLDLNLPPLQPSVDSLTGEVAQLALALPPAKLLFADHPYAEMAVRLPPMLGGLLALEGNYQATLGSVATARATMTASKLLLVFMASYGQAATAMVVQALHDALMDSAAVVDSVMSTTSVQEAVMASVASSAAMLGVPLGEMQTLVVNLETNGSTSYSAFDFNSFARLGNRYLGAGARGVVELLGDDDDGEPVVGRLHFGRLDFGSAQRKTIAECYVGMAADGRLVLRVTAEGRTFSYRTRSASEHLRQERVDLGKGLKANYFDLELFNEGGDDFEVDTIQLQVADLQRKI